MTDIPSFDFGSESVASSYDVGLVPLLFLPWARKISDSYGPWQEKRVLDLAAGTGVVTSTLGPLLGRSGEIVAADFNSEMLDLARKNCSNLTGTYSFTCCSADCLACPDATFDTVVCQQGFQFFPDKQKAAKEIRRVLKPGGQAIISTWLPVNRCTYFGALCLALEQIGEDELSAKMRVPFDYMPPGELQSCFDDAGFGDVRVEEQTLPLAFSGGMSAAVNFAYFTPIADRLLAFSEQRGQEFKNALANTVRALEMPLNVFGEMASTVLTARA